MEQWFRHKFQKPNRMKACPQCDSGYPDSLATCPTHGVPLNEIRDLKPGMVIRNTYRIVRKLGQGGMGAVYLAQHTLMNEPQALKFLSSELSQDQAFTARFLREVRTLRQIRHKNVVDAGNLEPAEDGTLFFSMEFVDGPDLRGFLKSCHPERPLPLSDAKGTGESKDLHLPSGALPVPLALHITRQIAEGLGAAHSKGMVHRDIKPENILMARDGDAWLPKIADFGIVATKESSTAYTRTGGTLLTMAYAAPEQWRGTPAAELDGRTDLYALGGLLYEMLTGRSPFQAENYEGWARQHQTTTLQPPSTLRPDLANWQGLGSLVLRLLAKDRSDRPKDVAEVIGQIDALQYVVHKTHRKPARRETAQELDIQQTETVIAKLYPHSRKFKGWVWASLVCVAVIAACWHFVPQLMTNQRQEDNLKQAMDMTTATNNPSPAETIAPDDLKRYYAVYKNRDVRYLRSLFNDYLAGRRVQTGGRDRADEFTLLDTWNKSYYKSKFIVLTFNKALGGGSQFSILFLDNPDRVFNVWVYPAAGEEPELRTFESAGRTEEEMVKIRAFCRQFPDDVKKHAL